MHYLQKTILDQLRYSPRATYTALMPDNLESSHFRYHLKQLMTEGLVQKNVDGLYTLTDKGQREIDYLSENRTTTIRTPKVITYTLLKHANTLLLYKKKKEPYIGLLGLIGGKIHFGEDIQKAAVREIQEKVGLTIACPILRGVANIRIDKDQEPQSHVVAYIFAAELDAIPDDLPADLVQVQRKSVSDNVVIPDLIPLLELLEVEKLQFVETIHSRLG